MAKSMTQKKGFAQRFEGAVKKHKRVPNIFNPVTPPKRKKK